MKGCFRNDVLSGISARDAKQGMGTTGNIQGTFCEHSGRVERTPVSLHPNCQKHLKKKKKSTNVDAEYNLQT
jgi:phosphoketolase